MNLSQKSLNRGRSIFFRESLVAASNKEKILRIKMFFKGNQCFRSWLDPDQNWVCGSRLGFRIQIQAQGGKIHAKIIWRNMLGRAGCFIWRDGGFFWSLDLGSPSWNLRRISLHFSMFRIRDPVPFLPLYPGYGMVKKNKIRIRDEHFGSYFRELRNNCWVKMLKKFNADADPDIFLTLDPEWKNSDPRLKNWIRTTSSFQL